MVRPEAESTTVPADPRLDFGNHGRRVPAGGIDEHVAVVQPQRGVAPGTVVAVPAAHLVEHVGQRPGGAPIGQFPGPALGPNLRGRREEELVGLSRGTRGSRCPAPRAPLPRADRGAAARRRGGGARRRWPRRRTRTGRSPARGSRPRRRGRSIGRGGRRRPPRDRSCRTPQCGRRPPDPGSEGAARLRAPRALPRGTSRRCRCRARRAAPRVRAPPWTCRRPRDRRSRR